MTPKAHLASDLLAVTSLTSSVAAWQEQLDWGLRILATLIAIAAGLIAIWSRLRAHRTRRDRSLD